MADINILVPLKVDLQISSTAQDTYLGQLIDFAETAIGTEGITLDLTSISDCMLVEMYAAHLYRKRRESETAMPRMLRWALNNRLLSERGASD